MTAKEVLEQALKLKLKDRCTVVGGLIKSLDEPDKQLDEVWAEEVEKRLKASMEGRLEGIPIEDVFKAG